MDQAGRLRNARERFFQTGSEAANAYGWKVSTYLAHENGQNKLREEAARRYAKAFKVDWTWLLAGEGRGPGRANANEVPLVGHVGAGAVAHYYAGGDDPQEMVPAPDGATANTVAVEIRGESLGALFDRWLVFYDDVRSPVTDDLIGRLCVVALADDRVLVKQLKRSRTNGFYHLVSNTEPTINDVEVIWAARVKVMVPRE